MKVLLDECTPHVLKKLLTGFEIITVQDLGWTGITNGALLRLAEVQFDVDSIGLEELGNPGWDPLCFSAPEGLLYYMPAMIRLTVDTIDNPRESYLNQMLFHLIKDGPGNRFVSACDAEQRKFIVGFLEYLITEHAKQISAEIFASDDILKAHEIWSRGNSEAV